MAFSRFAVILSMLSIALSAVVDCTYEAGTGVTYDLTPLRNDEQDYRILDRLGATGNRTFVMNFCRDVVSIPADGKGGRNCDTTIHDKDQGADVPESRPVPVFLVDNDSDECNRYSGSLEDKDDQGALKNLKFSAYDSDDITAGVTLRYSGGDYYFAGRMYKTTYVSVRCSDRATIADSADVERYGISAYMVWLDSVYGCPKECHPNSDGTICSGHGICMYDDSVEQSRCFCNTGFKSENCGKSVGWSMTNYAMVLDIVGVVVILGTIVYLSCKLRKIRLDPEADVSLDTKFNELGSIAYTL